MAKLLASGGILARALRLAAWPLLASVFVTLLRFLGERLEFPSFLTFLLGIIWLTLIVAAFWGRTLRGEEAPYHLLFITVLAFSLLSRIPVVILWWITSSYELGTHYDMYRNLAQAMLFQFGVSASVQTTAGFLFGSLFLFASRRNRPHEISSVSPR
jgi:hypothetical protein